MDRNSAIEKAKTPLSIIAIFAILAEIAMTYALGQVDKSLQPQFLWFVMGFPVLLLLLFFYTLYTKPAVLFAPSDYEKDTNYLASINQKKEIDDISKQVSELTESITTLMNYSEKIVENVAPGESSKIITEEKQRLEEAQNLSQLERIGLFHFIVDELNVPQDTVVEMIAKTSDIAELPGKVLELAGNKKAKSERLSRLIANFPKTKTDYRNAKELINKAI
jgi:hypothetical protein